MSGASKSLSVPVGSSYTFAVLVMYARQPPKWEMLVARIKP
ncbi:hypothetical protein [Rhodopseudomonas palustris]|uniref:Uncharacterized protein n=1 Tax=Rhodopseudomonas palustris (strain ATCC BAA-98 / CGA009) TaxID=258594 RepID=A0AAE9Y282_RHOPA|nr:hypothetical protein [Rhodopseudomonas palustris]QQM03916.1 hypothetical protein I8G32_02461 [Rhodopseudomonas palustris]WAB80050.1 hypothetical protein OR798_12390 [Rhodopseudomonas palustris]WCL92556.1 hypothetical protein TX73_012385 [Rhodopseudomonas palustris CGA009]